MITLDEFPTLINNRKPDMNKITKWFRKAIKQNDKGLIEGGYKRHLMGLLVSVSQSMSTAKSTIESRGMLMSRMMDWLMDAFLFNRKLIDLSYAPQDIKDVSVKAVREGLDRVKKIGRSSLAKSVFERTPFRPRKECINQFAICLNGILNGK